MITTVTGGVRAARARSGPDRPAPQLVLGYVSLWHSTRASARNSLAYSNIRRIWWPLAYLDLPLLFIVFTGVLALKPDTLVSLGKASGHLDRAGGSGTVRAPKSARALWLVVAVAFVVTSAGVPLAAAAVVGPAAAPTVMLAWWIVILGVPIVGYAVPAGIQSIGGDVQEWKTLTQHDTGRAPVFASMLGSWPNTGGGQKGTGDGFALLKALAADARSRNQIMVGVARSKTLANKYVMQTDAEQSSLNPRHVRWP